jgi:soluble lytic murein transglycosylase
VSDKHRSGDCLARPNEEHCVWNDRVFARGPIAMQRLAGLLALVSAAFFLSPASRADEDRSRLERLLEAADAGDWQWAKHLAAGAGGPFLQDYVRWRELLEGTVRPSFADYAAFFHAGTDWPSLGSIQARAEEAMDGAVPFADRLAFFSGREPRTRQGRILQAEALISANRATDAAALLRRAWVEDDFGAPEEELFLDRFATYLQPQDHSARINRLLWDGRTDQARRMLFRVRPAERAIAATRLKLQLSDPGVDAALAALPRDVRKDAGILFDRLRWRRKYGSAAGVREILLMPPDELRRPELWWREQDKAIRSALAERSFMLAYRLASAGRQTTGVPFAEAEWLAGWLALQFTGQPKAARRHFDRLWPAVSTPISRGRAGYWSGRAAAAAGDSEAAADWYDRAAGMPNSFYGQLAAAEVGVDPSRRLPQVRSPSPAAQNALRRRTPAELGSLFCGQGQPRYAHPFFRHLGYEAADDPDELAAVVELAQSCGRAELVLAATRGAAGNGAHLVQESFPLPRITGFRGGQDGVADAALLLAVSRQESLFDPVARSPAGALGLMQLMPGTAQSVARELGEPFSRARLVRDPNYNLRLGAHYLGQQLTQFGNEPVLALAAYNAGPSRVREWLELNGDPRGGDRYGVIDWIELIPFAETRNYVQRVLEGRGMYRVALGQPALPDSRSAASEPRATPRAKPAS